MNTDTTKPDTMQTRLNELAIRTMCYDEGDPKRIQHLIKVHYFARLIGMSEQLAPEVLFILEAAAIVHDIGIHICEKKYGTCDGNIKNSKVRPLLKIFCQKLEASPQSRQNVSAGW